MRRCWNREKDGKKGKKAADGGKGNKATKVTCLEDKDVTYIHDVSDFVQVPKCRANSHPYFRVTI